MKRKILMASAACVAAIGLAFAAVVTPTGRAVQGIYLDSKDVSRYTPEELREEIDRQFESGPTTLVIVDDTNKKQTVSFKDIGVRANREATVEAIMAYGYEQDLWTYVTHRLQALLSPVRYHLVYEINEPTGESFLRELGNRLDAPGKDAFLTYEGGKVIHHKAVPGKRLDIKATLAALKENARAGQLEMLPLVIDTKAKPKIGDSDIAPITTLLAVYTTQFNPGDENRTHNIQLATDKINGVLLGPGKTFSFNDVVGERTAEAGYDDAPVFMDGKLVPGIGGGICQVSSTLFNTALLSGMTIDERTPHFEPVGYIPAGRDATVAYGYLDFIFHNPYTHPVYIRAVTEGDSLVIYMFGTEADKPKQVTVETSAGTAIMRKTIEKTDATKDTDEIREGHNGMSMMTLRHITKADGSIKTDRFESVYDPVDTVIIRGTKPKEAAKPKAQSTKPSTSEN
ncbi:VanW family protein [Veillonella magna]|uniref:VanW family protein n=1 Tax=Veillonella magna TaxID=464322 RepID=A0ABS2GE46_9FIRM|nr:VanW family protein [Veillonella magna]MBM6823448.1 VanW family protein [Veillonella magna]MBM6911792.1 VanW family protein [Veillonella magna]